MDGMHDLGGRHGLGAINPEKDEPVFHSDWERSVLTMFPALAMAGALNIDKFRFGMEQIPGPEYLTSRYYEHWMDSLLHHGVVAGLFDAEDVERRTQHYLEHPDENAPKAAKPEMVETLRHILANGDSYKRETEVPAKFSVGDAVRVLPDASTTHTRRAAYVRGRIGEIVAAHGAYVYPDTNAIGLGECPEHLYTVRFSAVDLWGEEPGAANSLVHVDLWEPYLATP
jgi:nitrile hydratase